MRGGEQTYPRPERIVADDELNPPPPRQAETQTPLVVAICAPYFFEHSLTSFEAGSISETDCARVAKRQTHGT